MSSRGYFADFAQTLGSRPAPFLKWTTGAPAGYLGDPNVEHAVTGSPYGTNFFRIEGPAGSFTGSTQLCADASLGESSTATDDCIQSNDFTVMGKLATRAGVQVSNAYYADSGTGHMMDIFAKSEPGQNLVITGTGEETRDFIFVDDLVDGLVRSSREPGAHGQALNLGSGVSTRILDLAESVVDMTGSKGGIVFGERRPWDKSTRRQADISRAREVLGFQPQTKLEDGLGMTLDWFERHYDLIKSSAGTDGR